MGLFFSPRASHCRQARASGQTQEIALCMDRKTWPPSSPEPHVANSPALNCARDSCGWKGIRGEGWPDLLRDGLASPAPVCLPTYSRVKPAFSLQTYHSTSSECRPQQKHRPPRIAISSRRSRLCRIRSQPERSPSAPSCLRR